MGKELVTLSAKDYPVLTDGGAAADLIRQNLGGEEVTPDLLTRIRVPTGGAITWEVPSADGDTESAKELIGVIVYITRRRAYWKSSDPTGDPPDCSSSDYITYTGQGKPGGDCKSCPLNEFKSDLKSDGTPGRGKACKENKLVFLLRKGQTMPDIVVVSPGSLQSMLKYQFSLSVPYCQLVTRLTLMKDKNKDGIAYAQIRGSIVGKLDAKAATTMGEYATSLQSVFSAVTLSQADVDGETKEV